MILVDTSLWVDHLRRGHAALVAALERAEVACHPFVIGELACGSLRNRAEVLGLLAALPRLPLAEPDDVLAFVSSHRLSGRGIGWVDAHLLAAAALARTPLWTLDRKLHAAAARVGIAA